MIDALRMVDHYQWRVAMMERNKAAGPLTLRKAPALSGEAPWWTEDY